MLLTLIRIFFGVDMALGFFNYTGWSWLMARHFNIWFLFLSIFSTHLPDVDMIPYLVLRRRYGLISHWIFGHHPLLVLPLIGAFSFETARVWSPDDAGYIVAIVTAGVFLHFAHDGMGRWGFPWLSPFSMKRFRYHSGRFSVVSKGELEERREQVLQWRKQAETSAADEILVRTPPMTPAQLLFWAAGTLALVIFVMETSWR